MGVKVLLGNFNFPSIRKAIGALKRWLRYSNTFSFSSKGNVTISGEEWSWRCKSPMVNLNKNNKVKVFGYYILEIKYEASSHISSSILHADYGCFKANSDEFLLPLKLAKNKCVTVKRICYFSSHVSSLTWQPSDQPGSIKGVSIKLIKLTNWKAKSLMIKKLNSHLTYKEENGGNNKLTYAAYDNLFKPILTQFDYIGWKEEYKKEFVGFARPNVSLGIVVTPYLPNSKWLGELFDSILKQSYSNWKLYVVLDKKIDTKSAEILYEIKEREPEKVFLIEVKESLSLACRKNIAITKSCSDYVMFADQHDRFTNCSFAQFAKLINSNPTAKIIYSDEEYISESSSELGPGFKPDWNVDALYSFNYIGLACFYSLDLLNSIGCFSESVSGAEAYDLLLRISDKVTDDEVSHVQNVLYQKRIYDETAHKGALNLFEIEKSNEAVLREYFKQRKMPVVVRTQEKGLNKFDWQLSTLDYRVSIIIVVSNEFETLKACLDSLFSQTKYVRFDLTMVCDISSSSNLKNYLKVMSYEPNINAVFAESGSSQIEMKNIALSLVDGDFVCFVKSDTRFVDDNWLLELLAVSERNTVGCVGGKVLANDLSIKQAVAPSHLGACAPHFSQVLNIQKENQFSWINIEQQVLVVSKDFILIRKSLINEVGGFNEKLNDTNSSTDLCLKIHDLGYKNIYVPSSTVISTVAPEGCTLEQVDLDVSYDSIDKSTLFSPNLVRNNQDFFRYG